MKTTCYGPRMHHFRLTVALVAGLTIPVMALAEEVARRPAPVHVFVLYQNTAPDGTTDLRVHDTELPSLDAARRYIAQTFVRGLETVQVDIPPVDNAADCCATIVWIAPGQLRKAWVR